MPSEGLKWRVNRAVKRSTLPPPSRLVMFVLSDRADSKTAVIPEEYTPSLAELAEETGLGEATVKRHLASLEASGWVTRERPTGEQMARHVPNRYSLAIGSGGSERAPGMQDSGGQSEPPAQAQSEPPRESPGAQSEPFGGSERAHAGAQSEPPSSICDRDDQNDLKNSSADADGERDGALFPVADTATSAMSKTSPAARFEEFYKTYPRHKAKARAETAWIKAIKAGAEPQVLIEAAWLFSIKTKHKDPNYLPYPATWLNDRGWEDEDDPSSPAPQVNGYQPFRNPTDPNAYTGAL